MFLQIILACTTPNSFDQMPDTINKIIGHIGNRFVRTTTSNGVLIETDLSEEDKNAIMEIAANPGKIEVYFVEIPEGYQGTINDLFVKSKS